MTARTYREAGVDIQKGNRFAEYIKQHPSPAVSSSIGGFAAGAEIDLSSYRKPVLLSTTDGVGTKLLIAQKARVYDTVGIDLVAMCVNDLIVCGANPLSFLDYIAFGSLAEEILQQIAAGIIRGCEQAGCALTGGETAELPDMYEPGAFDLAGFAVGIAEKEDILPRLSDITEGSVIFGLPSTGIHSNGFSLARKALPLDDSEIVALLLQPTKIYVSELAALLKSGNIKAAAHITGGGLVENIARVLPKGLKPELAYNWPIPEIFPRIQSHGDIAMDEMRQVFNMGIGIALIITKEKAQDTVTFASNSGVQMIEIGAVVSADEG